MKPAEAVTKLREILREADAMQTGWSCPTSGDCCRFQVTGREPYLWPVEWALLERAIAARGTPRKRSKLVVLDDLGSCPLLDRGRCTVYADRPFGCRTYYCGDAEGPVSARARRDGVAPLGRAIATLSEQAFASSGGPRTLTSWLSRR